MHKFRLYYSTTHNAIPKVLTEVRVRVRIRVRIRIKLVRAQYP